MSDFDDRQFAWNHRWEQKRYYQRRMFTSVALTAALFLTAGLTIQFLTETSPQQTAVGVHPGKSGGTPLGGPKSVPSEGGGAQHAELIPLDAVFDGFIGFIDRARLRIVPDRPLAIALPAGTTSPAPAGTAKTQGLELSPVTGSGSWLQKLESADDRPAALVSNTRGTPDLSPVGYWGTGDMFAGELRPWDQVIKGYVDISEIHPFLAFTPDTAVVKVTLQLTVEGKINFIILSEDPPKRGFGLAVAQGLRRGHHAPLRVNGVAYPTVIDTLTIIMCETCETRIVEIGDVFVVNQ